MELKGKITIFPEMKEKENDKGEVESFIVCRGTISSKNESGAYVNKSVNVRFAGDKFPKEKVNRLDPEKCYSLELEKGFLAVSEITNSHGTRRELEIVVLEGKLTGSKVVERPVVEEKPADSDLPF